MFVHSVPTLWSLLDVSSKVHSITVRRKKASRVSVEDSREERSIGLIIGFSSITDSNFGEVTDYLTSITLSRLL